jgi:hypothetical protein
MLMGRDALPGSQAEQQRLGDEPHQKGKRHGSQHQRQAQVLLLLLIGIRHGAVASVLGHRPEDAGGVGVELGRLLEGVERRR